MPVSAPSDRHFRRRQTSPGRRVPLRAWWKKLAFGVVGGVTGLAIMQALAVLATTAATLSVSTISVHGNSRVSTGEVQALLDGMVGANLLTVNIDAWRQKLLASPWISDAAIRRHLPGTVAVDITERVAAAIGRVNGTLYLIDQDGRIIDDFGPSYAALDLPLVDGLAVGRRAAFTVDENRAELAARLFAALQHQPGLARRVSQIDVTDPNDVVVVLKDDTVLVHLGGDRFLERLHAYLELVPHLRERVPEIDYVDLRYDERVYVGPQPARSGATAGDRRRTRADKG